MRALVTGAAGFIGAALTRSLAADGWEVAGIVRPGSHLGRLEPRPPNVRLWSADLTELGAVRSAIRASRPEVVFHAAGPKGHPATGEDRAAGWRDCVLGTVCLLEALNDSPASSLVHLGSSLEYAPAARPLRETDPLRPTTPRGAMKLAATVAVEQWARQAGRAATVIRPFSVYGPLEPPGRLVPTLVRCLRSRSSFQTTTEEFRRDFVFIDDVVRACRLAAEQPAAAGRAVNVGTAVGTTTQAVVELAQSVARRRIEVRSHGFPPRPSDTPWWTADISLARSLLGWEPTVDLEEGLRRTLLAGAAL